MAVIVATEWVKVHGGYVPAEPAWLLLVPVLATLLCGWASGVSAGLLAVFYLLKGYDAAISSNILASPVHFIRMMIVTIAAAFLAEILHLRDLGRRREAIAGAAAEAARLSEERFRTALRAAPITVFSQNRNLQYTWFSSSAPDIPADAILGKFDSDIIDDPDDLAKVLAMKRWVLETGAGVRQEACVRLFGKPRFYDITIEPLRDEDGQITGITCAAVDITNLNHTLEALREQEIMLARAQRIANIGSWEIQVEPRRVIWSDQMYRIFGLQRDHFAPTVDALLPYIHPDDKHSFMVATLHAVRNGTPFCQELRINRPDGATRMLLVQAERMPGQPEQATRVVGTVLDITDRKRTEAQLHTLNETLEQRVAERTAEAERRALQLRRLASQLTQVEQGERRRLAQLLHDHLQQLLVGAKFGIGIAKGQAKDEAILHSLKQVNDMLDQSIKVSRSLTMELSPPILYDGGLSAGLQWLAGWVREKYELRVNVTVDQQAEPEREDIRVLLFQAARELLFNIVKHAGVKQADLLMSRLNNDRVRIVVADAGSGFEASRLAAAETKGGGYGLFSIRERLEMLEGRLDITSTPGEGTQVTLIAPIHGEQAEPPPAKRPA